MCFSIANRGIRQHPLTDDFGLTCRMKGAKDEPFPLEFVAHPASPNRNSVGTSSPRVSTASSPSQATQHRPLHSAPKQKSGSSHFLLGDVSRSNPLRFPADGTH